MKVLFVRSGNAPPGNLSFIKEQAESLRDIGCVIHFFPVKGKGVRGYLINLPELKRVIQRNRIDLVHAHYGLSGWLAVLQKSVPVVVTYQGTDIHEWKYRVFSKAAMRRSEHDIFVSSSLRSKVRYRGDSSIIPYGVDMAKPFIPMDKEECRRKLGFSPDEKLALFSSSFDRAVKNYPLARKDQAGFGM